MLAWVTNGLHHHGRCSDSAVSHVKISSKSCDRSQSDCVRSDYKVSHRNLPSAPDPSFPVYVTESDPCYRFGWVWLARLKYCKHFNSHGPGLLDSGPVSVHNDSHDCHQQQYEAQCQHTHSNRCIVKGRQTQGRLICWGC